ncbi:uncharacterized protein LOC122392684 [Amphibalanus amphitrite]|uniref:uncharacterized protein LOC122392684 n=1 Tax=Amphibalanus amphitrite TaxID=1232801 RepID=UPI001C9100CF|nr:uncharacterized protein LOC122392684 [Amphibalanus amphitrite]
MEREVRHLLRLNFQPAPASSADGRPEPVHLQVLNEVHGPTLRRQLNRHLAEVPAAAGGEDCAHCHPAGRLQIRSATISGSVADRVGWLSLHGHRLPLRSDNDFLLELDVSRSPLATEAAAAEGEPCVAPSAVLGYYRRRCAVTGAVRRHRRGEGPPTVNGPAVTFCDAGGAVDCVPCVAVCASAAVPWLAELRARPRPSGWPEDRLLARLDRTLLLVPTGPHAEDDRLWRLSFSRQEAQLVRGLPPSARYCLMLLKAVKKERRDRLANVSSYYLKTCVLWMCQQRQETEWRDSLAAMDAVLEMLRQAVDDKVLPSFFCSEINVLRDPTDERLADIRRGIRYFQEEMLNLLHEMFTSLRPAKPITLE